MNEEMLLELNYKKPERLELLCLLGREVRFVYNKNATGTITKVYRSKWDKKEKNCNRTMYGRRGFYKP